MERGVASDHKRGFSRSDCQVWLRVSCLKGPSLFFAHEGWPAMSIYPGTGMQREQLRLREKKRHLLETEIRTVFTCRYK